MRLYLFFSYGNFNIQMVPLSKTATYPKSTQTHHNHTNQRSLLLRTRVSDRNGLRSRVTK